MHFALLSRTMYVQCTYTVRALYNTSQMNRKPFYSIHILYMLITILDIHIYTCIYDLHVHIYTCNCSTTVVVVIVVVVVVARTSENIYSVVESVLASSECNSDIGQGTECKVQSAEVSLSWF